MIFEAPVRSIVGARPTSTTSTGFGLSKLDIAATVTIIGDPVVHKPAFFIGKSPASELAKLVVDYLQLEIPASVIIIYHQSTVPYFCGFESLFLLTTVKLLHHT